jgi:hypothetical protein
MHGVGTWKINVTTSLSATLIVRYIDLVIHTKYINFAREKNIAVSLCYNIFFSAC